MTLAAGLKKLLESKMIAYRVLQHKRVERLDQAASLLQCDPHKMLTAQVLEDNQGMLLVVYRLSTKINMDELRKLLNRNLTVVATTKINRLFNDCDAGCWPPIGQAYGLDVLIDKNIEQYDSLYFSSGSNTSIVQIETNAYLHLNSRAKILYFTENISNTDDKLGEIDHHKANILNSLSLPALPPMALQILQLSMSHEYSAKELAEILSKDQQLQQQIMDYSQLPFNQDKSEVPVDVAEHVLGFDKISHIALGVAASRAFTHHEADVEYTQEFWRHAFCAATYAERITQLVTETQNLDPALSYLAGLFHNFGLLLFSQAFHPEFTILRKWMDLNPKASIATLEKKLLGMGRAFNIVPGGHAQLGEWLLRHWNMPEAVCVVAKEHHSLSYHGKFSSYVKIIQLTNQLLKEDGIGDGSYGGISEQLLEPLGLTEQQVRDSVKNIKLSSVNLEQITHLLTNK